MEVTASLRVLYAYAMFVNEEFNDEGESIVSHKGHPDIGMLIMECSFKLEKEFRIIPIPMTEMYFHLVLHV